MKTIAITRKLIEAQADGVTPNIIKITRSELNRRLGGMVVIIDDENQN